MCGIAGIRRFDGQSVDRETLERMAATIRHRGPDAMGIWLDGPVGLAHTRLSIIDLQGSQQPMTDAGGQRHLVFNGEILNYQELRAELSYPFQTHGDTETLLAVYDKYGPAGVNRLRGQFAYAIYDANTGDTHIFRDRLGVLPLYYYADSHFFAFASEIKALLPVINGPSVDEDSLNDYLAHRSVPAPHTLIRGVRKLPAGHRLVVTRDGGVRVSAYWELASQASGRTVTAEEAVDLVEQALRTSVRDNLVADVPVGVYLSGGIDSSLLTAMTRRENPGQLLHTFGASFGDERYDETVWARKVAELNGTTHHDVVVTADDFMNNWGKLSWQRDGPLSEPADVAVFRLAQLAREQVKVVLSGEGSDELFAGYPKYKFAGATRWLGAVPSLGLLGRLESALPASKARLRIAMRAMDESTYDERLRGWFAPFTVAERSRMTGRPSLRGAPAAYSTGRGDALRRMLYADTVVWLAENLLERGDRMSMAASLETRPPFLDHRLVDLAFDLPSSVKIRDRKTKWVVKQVAHRYLPADIVDRRKVGFKVPLDRWFRHGLRDMAFDLLTGPSSYVGNNFDNAMVSGLLSDHAKGVSDEESRIWTLLSLEVWHREFVERAIS
ncbi:asparagine synthase (glutamine-hydrolyzing) [Mycolicibacterium sp. Dal123E01]|uniref:asparagine synthase (glutamine-hydrolyzing) n=1 Tax=Mycolicibacterium sp. Dal123E01 TaxID=3457578 RepID=UPI00403E657D